DAGELGGLRTLRQIVARMDASAAAAPARAAQEAAPSAPRPAAPAPAAASVDLQALMLEVVAEKTGYPADMLNLDMELESDLGVDSIKRVEILSAMREREPNLPEDDDGTRPNPRPLRTTDAHIGATTDAVAAP